MTLSQEILEISPLLFIMLKEKCIRDTNPQPNQQVLACANDVAVMADTIQQLQDVANSWLSRMDEKGMTINRAK